MPREDRFVTSQLDQQLCRLQEERKVCVQRLTELIANPEREAEIVGYLSIIENINDSAIRLARGGSEHQRFDA